MSNKIPAGWEIKTIGDIGSVVTGSTPSTTEPSYWNGEIPFISPADFDGEVFLRQTSRTLTAEGVKKARLLPKESILVTCIGSLGGMAMTSKPSVTNQQINAVIVKKSEKSLFHFYNILFNMHELIRSAGTTTLPIINKTAFSQIDLLVPPLPEQQKIATILSSVDNVIEKTRAQIDKLKDLKTGMMQELLTKGIGHTEFKDSPVGHVPVSWKVRPIGELLEFKNGLNKGKEYFGRGNPIVNFMDVFQNHGISIANLEGKVELTESEQQRFEVKQGDVFFTRTSEIPSEIGMSAVFLDQVDNVSFSGFTLRGRPVTEDLEMQFCKYCFSSDYVRTQIVSSCSYTTRALTNGSLLSQCLVAIPPKDEQLKITLAIDSVDDAVKTKQQGLSSLENTKKALMQVLLTGKVRVTPDESAVI